MKIAVFGATSAIALSVERLYAAEGHEFFLVGRQKDRCESVANDLLARGARRAEVCSADLSCIDTHSASLREMIDRMGVPDLCLVAYGILGDSQQTSVDAEKAVRVIHTNFVSTVALCLALAPHLKKNPGSCLAVISSIAGDRGRQTNFIYGSSKGGLNIFLQGFRSFLFRDNVHVLTIKPGFVRTPMTQHLRDSFLFADPDAVAKRIVWAIRRRKDEVYVPAFWLLASWIMRLIPECVFKRLRV